MPLGGWSKHTIGFDHFRWLKWHPSEVVVQINSPVTWILQHYSLLPNNLSRYGLDGRMNSTPKHQTDISLDDSSSISHSADRTERFRLNFPATTYRTSLPFTRLKILLALLSCGSVHWSTSYRLCITLILFLLPFAAPITALLLTMTLVYRSGSLYLPVLFPRFGYLLLLLLLNLLHVD